MANFDEQSAFKYLKNKENEKKEEAEVIRKKCLEETKIYLKNKFQGQPIEIYLIGSILKPYGFSTRSDIDIVIRYYQGERFSLWAEIEAALKRPVELIPYETCPFQEEVKKNGLKVM